MKMIYRIIIEDLDDKSVYTRLDAAGENSIEHALMASMTLLRFIRGELTEADDIRAIDAAYAVINTVADVDRVEMN